MEINIKEVKEEYKESALNLVLDSYQNLKKEISFLPTKSTYKQKFKDKIEHLFEKGLGVIALQEDKLIGFLIGYEVDELFGKDKGVYVPLYAHAAVNNKKRVYQKMYTRAAELWINRCCVIHALTIFTCDKDVIHAFYWLGFGLRCIDAIQKVDLIEKSSHNKVKIIKAELKEIELMEELYKKDNLYYGSSPLFMPVNQKSNIDKLRKWLNKDNHHLWMALIEDRVVGYIRIEPTGETVISTYSKMMNITGAFVEEKYRDKRIGKFLLDEVLIYLKKNNYMLCGVDFESFNILGSNFWNKYFKPYTYSVVRHIEK